MENILRFSLESRKRPVWVRYATSLLLVIAAFFLHQLIFSSHEAAYPFLLFYPVIIVTSIFLDHGNGVFASVLSSVCAAYYLIPRQAITPEENILEVIAILLFLVTALSIAIFLESMTKYFTKLLAANVQISDLAQSRKVLLDELSHRTRNDMATLNSLFLLQAHTLKDAAAKQAFRNAADRMRILSRVHERLTVTMDQVVIDSRDFISRLCADLQQTMFATKPIALEVSVEPHPVSHQKAVAIGLIVNELITNAMKYAFPENASGKVSVSFTQKDHFFRLRVSDNGVGIQESAEKNGTGLGLELVRTLAAQLGGSLESLKTEKGVDFEVVFPR